MMATLWNLGWTVGSITLALLILYAVESRRSRRRREEINKQCHGYSLTPQAAEYRLYWSKETLAAIDARCKEIAKKENADVIDVPIIKQAILEVAHNEWVKLSNRR